MPDIILKSLTARIRNDACLHDLSLKLEHGQQWAVIGSNGSGKTAFGQLLCGTLEILSGDLINPAKSEYVSFEKVTEILNLERYNDDSNSKGGADPGTSVKKYILAGRQHLGNRLLTIAEQLHFSDLLDQGIKFLSTGEMRKVVICGAILENPELLVLDEPFDGLDRDACVILKQLISTLVRSGTQIVLLLNRFSEILPEVTHIAYLKNCRIVSSGPKDRLLRSDALQRLHDFHKLHSHGLPEPPASWKKSEATANTAGAPVIEMRRVTVGYGGKTVLNSFDWTVMPGEHWIISGPNGSGKTTLLNLISGDNTQAYANDISLFGRKKGSGESVWDIKQRIGHLSTALQRSYRIPGTALSVIISGFFDSIGIYRQHSREQFDIACQWLDLLKMEQHKKRRFTELSFGEQRLLLLARAMVKHPNLLILDEPCQGLDDLNRAMVLKLIDHIGSNGNTQILYVTHHPEDHIPCINRSLKLVPAEAGGSAGVVEFICPT